MSEIIITCSPDNISSIRTCEKVGAEYMGLIEIPQWHEMYATGRRMSCNYLIRLLDYYHMIQKQKRLI